MALRFLGKDTIDGGSPTLFDDGDRYVLQGWIVTDPGVLSKLALADHETLVEVPKELMKFLPEGVVVPSGPPLVVDRDETYVFRGPLITDPAVLAQLDMPSHETVIEIPKTALEVTRVLERRSADV
ncbi:hypothetical protein Sme01_23390 [Sphaerisporangium melleum]|uniref:Uncharacterized protein n=1 Tax=Sphaerisporangium melleum TaxID=321316 RepID=A0A917VUZ7_9ACTN|nr:hypothetical protein [Sphaerisporangium melleum]GGL20911.1 hypothetical protein GCM10007964_73570 [Sphaerisporangium melleum]GII69863.1 hypothetical protein Sme01_23390 [Sphaerisporangium melleum]